MEINTINKHVEKFIICTKLRFDLAVQLLQFLWPHWDQSESQRRLPFRLVCLRWDVLCVFSEREHPCRYDHNPPHSSTLPGWSTHFCLIVHLDTSSLIRLACAYQPWSIALRYEIILCGTFNSISPVASLSGVISESFLMGLGANDCGKPIYSSISPCHVFMTFHNCLSKRNLVQVLQWLFF